MFGKGGGFPNNSNYFCTKKEKLFLYDMKVTLWFRMNLNLRFTIRRNVFITQMYSAYPSKILTFLVKTNFENSWNTVIQN